MRHSWVCTWVWAFELVRSGVSPRMLRAARECGRVQKTKGPTVSDRALRLFWERVIHRWENDDDRQKVRDERGTRKEKVKRCRPFAEEIGRRARFGLPHGRRKHQSTPRFPRGKRAHAGGQIAPTQADRGCAGLRSEALQSVSGIGRCPKASAHWQDCTGSNDPGQWGSFYGPEESWPTPQRCEDK